MNTTDKAAIASEITSLTTEIGEIGTQTKFNGTSLLAGGTQTFQVGANDGETIATTGVNLATAVSGVSSSSTLADIDTAIGNVSSARSDFGAIQNRLEHRVANLASYQENLVSAESRIRDVDMASEMVNFSKLQILQQAGTAMLAQANQAPQGVLSLLRG